MCEFPCWCSCRNALIYLDRSSCLIVFPKQIKLHMILLPRIHFVACIFFFFFIFQTSRFLGHFQPQQGKPALWELDSDQHYGVGMHDFNFAGENARYYYIWEFGFICILVAHTPKSANRETLSRTYNALWKYSFKVKQGWCMRLRQNYDSNRVSRDFCAHLMKTC